MRRFSPNATVLVFIGPRGSGKTTIGLRVAQRLDRAFIDLDQQIERAAGASVAALFAARGEAHFRELEHAALCAALPSAPQAPPTAAPPQFAAVLSVGGGAVLRADNRAVLAPHACVWLTAPPEELCRRLTHDPRSATLRPALTELPLLEELNRLSREREPLYAQLAAVKIDTAALSAEQVTARVLEWVDTALADVPR